MTESGGVILHMQGITKLYAGTVALDQVDLSVRRGEVHGLIGKNGAGKSTLVGVLSGLVRPSRGRITVNGESFDHFTPIRAKRHRISIITQEPQVVDEASVTENLFMPVYARRQLIPWQSLEKQAAGILERAGFPIDPATRMGDLSISEKQLLLAVKACYVEEAEIIIMDEVTASLTQKDAAILYRIISERQAAGKTVIFISHHTGELLRVCDRVTVLRDGKSVGCFDCAELDQQKIAALIVGESRDQRGFGRSVQRDIRAERPLLELRGFTRYGKFQDIDLQLYTGEIVGLAGLRGSGRTEIFKSIVGIDGFDKGQVLFRGRLRRYGSPAQASKDGVLYLSEEREREGLIPIASIRHNLTASVLPQLSRLGVLSDGKEKKLAVRLMQTLDVKAFSQEQEISQLSGGNKQKVLVGKIMAHNPTVCLLDEPTRGVDIGAKDSILHTIDEELRQGSCVLLSSPGIDDLIKICDRILVLYEGRIIDSFTRDQFNEEEIFRATQGEIIHGAKEALHA